MIVKLKIYYFSVFGDGTIKLELNYGATVFEVLEKLDKIYGEIFQAETGKRLLSSFGVYFNVFLDDQYLRFPEDYKRKLRENECFIISRPISGG